MLMKIYLYFCIFFFFPAAPLFSPPFLPFSKCNPHQLVLSPIWTWTTPPLTATIKSTILFTTLLPDKFISGSINLLHIQISHSLLAQIRHHQTALFHSPSYSASEFRLVYLLTDACWHSDPKWFSNRKSLANCAKKLHRLTGGYKVSSSFFQSTGSAPGTTITGHQKGHVNFAAEDNTSSSAPTTFIKSVKEMPSSLSVVQTSDLPLGAVDFEGWIPKEIGKLKHLVKLDIAICGITGRIPEEIGVLENLNTLFAQVNGTLIQLWENNFIGNILARLESSGKLQLLDLSSNKLTGNLANELCVENSLHTLIAVDNFLSGLIPSGLLKFPELAQVELQNNMLDREFPNAGFYYLTKMHFCEIQLMDLWVDLHLDDSTTPQLLDAILKRLEVFKLESNGCNLAEPNPGFFPDVQSDNALNNHKKSKSNSDFASQQSDITELKSALRQLPQTLAEISAKPSSYPPLPQSVFATTLQSQPDSLIQTPSPTHFAFPLLKIDNPTNRNYDIDTLQPKSFIPPPSSHPSPAPPTLLYSAIFILSSFSSSHSPSTTTTNTSTYPSFPLAPSSKSSTQILKALNLLRKVEDMSSCNGTEKKLMFHTSDAPFNQTLKVLDKMAHPKLIVTYSLDFSYTTLSPINVNYGHVSDNLCTFSYTTNIMLVFSENIIAAIIIDNETFFDNIDTFILVIPTSDIVAAIRSFFHPSPFAIDFISVHFLFDKLDFTLHKSNKISLSIVTFSSLISQPDNNLHYAKSSRIRNLEPDILSSTIVFSLLVPTPYNYDNKIIFNNINTSIFNILISGTVATVRSSLHSSLFVINHFLVHFLFDKPSFASHKSISIFRYTFTLSSLITQLNENRHQVIHYHLENTNVDILSSPHIALIFTSKISFDNTSFNFAQYSPFFTIESISDLEDKVNFKGRVMIRISLPRHHMKKAAP